MRTIEEMTKDALHLRNGLLEKSIDPQEHVFYVSPEEHSLLKMQPYSDVRLNHVEDRFCGLRVLTLMPERESQE
jgi:hypothetical protein